MVILASILGFTVFIFASLLFITMIINKNKEHKLENFTYEIRNNDIIKDMANIKSIESKNFAVNSKSLDESSALPLLEYIEKIENSKTIKDNDINNALDLLLDALKNIDEYINEHPLKLDDIKTMADYYIIELVNNIKLYAKISEKSRNAVQKEKMKKELIETINIITNAFSTVLSEFYDSLSLSVSSSLQAINHSVKLKGYIK